RSSHRFYYAPTTTSVISLPLHDALPISQYFLAVRDGRPVGRIAAIKNDAHTREHGDRVGFYGFFESVNEQAVANALFEAAAGWLDRKSTRLNSSHVSISYAVFCLKKTNA